MNAKLILTPPPPTPLFASLCFQGSEQSGRAKERAWGEQKIREKEGGVNEKGREWALLHPLLCFRTIPAVSFPSCAFFETSAT